MSAPTLGRVERYRSVGSTNDVVRGWLAAGEPEICLAVADEQTAGRGRSGRTWVAPPGAGLLLSVGFRPTWLEPDRVWRLAAGVSLAMAEAAEQVAGLPDGSIGLKWPNDLVARTDGPHRKVGGVLGETAGLGTDDPRVVVGIGLNADWNAADFPSDIASAMTSLRAMSGVGDAPIDREALLDAFIVRLDAVVGALRGGTFDIRGWVDRQVTTGRTIELVDDDGGSRLVAAVGVDPETGALRIADDTIPGAGRSVFVGEIRHAHLASV
jgi:BirA family transcriptional regulator, biotin operon repressor / biotin---[acetyl-CoA-carboxylase] ligase